MRLHSYFRSSAAYRVRIALALKGLSYDYVPVHLLKKEQSLPEYRRLAPSQLVPALELDDGKTALTQSLAIIEYLDETHPEPPLLPAEPLGRARVRALALDIACDIHPIDNLRVLRYLTGGNEGIGGRQEPLVQALGRDRARGARVRARRAPVDRPVLPRRYARPGRLHPRAAGLQRPAHGLPGRPRADGDADFSKRA